MITLAILKKDVLFAQVGLMTSKKYYVRMKDADFNSLCTDKPLLPVILSCDSQHDDDIIWQTTTDVLFQAIKGMNPILSGFLQDMLTQNKKNNPKLPFSPRAKCQSLLDFSNISKRPALLRVSTACQQKQEDTVLTLSSMQSLSTHKQDTLKHTHAHKMTYVIEL